MNRLEHLEQTRGKLEAQEWTLWVAGIYRKAVLNPDHYAATPQYRRKFIIAYLEFKKYSRTGIL